MLYTLITCVYLSLSNVYDLRLYPQASFSQQQTSNCYSQNGALINFRVYFGSLNVLKKVDAILAVCTHRQEAVSQHHLDNHQLLFKRGLR